MDEKLRSMLEKVPRSYEDFVNGVIRQLKGNNEAKEKLIHHIEQNPEEQTGKVLEYIYDVLLAS